MCAWIAERSRVADELSRKGWAVPRAVEFACNLLYGWFVGLLATRSNGSLAGVLWPKYRHGHSWVCWMSIGIHLQRTAQQSVPVTRFNTTNIRYYEKKRHVSFGVEAHYLLQYGQGPVQQC